jgi:transposase-like protein
MGRPTKLTKARRAGIVSMIAAGSYAEVAARANGVGPSTYYAWMKRGEDAEVDDTGKPLDFDDERYVEFREAVKEAEAKAEVLAVGRIQQAAAGGTWQASAWYLERKYPDRWGRKDHVRQEISGPGGGPVEIDAEAAALAFLDERAGRLAEAGIVPEETEGSDPSV